MATLPILGTAAAATAGTSATISPKGTLARLGLRTPSGRKCDNRKANTWFC